MFRKLHHAHGTLGGRILYVMGLIDDKHAESEIIRKTEGRRRFVCSDGNAALVQPFPDCRLLRRAVDLDDAEKTEPLDFPAPVDHDTGRADHYEVGGPCISQRDH